MSVLKFQSGVIILMMILMFSAGIVYTIWGLIKITKETEAVAFTLRMFNLFAIGCCITTAIFWISTIVGFLSGAILTIVDFCFPVLSLALMWLSLFFRKQVYRLSEKPISPKPHSKT